MGNLFLIKTYASLVVFVLGFNLLNLIIVNLKSFEKLRPCVNISFLHHVFVEQLFLDFIYSLYVGIGYFAELVGVTGLNLL